MIPIEFGNHHLTKRQKDLLLNKQRLLNRKRSVKTRHDFIAQYPTWSKLSKRLAELSDYKCWYTEVYDLGSYFHVDHFRPKNGLKINSKITGQNLTLPHSLQVSGYWWEAYNWQNYRLSSARTNSGSKSSYFPITRASAFWLSKRNVNTEVCMLIDPLIPADCDLLLFDADGKIYPNPSTASTVLLKEKVEASIIVLGLNDDAFIKARKAEWLFTESIATMADEFHQRLLAGGLAADIDSLLRKSEKVLIDILKKRIEKTAQFSKLNYWCLISTGKRWIYTDIIGLP